MRYPLLFLLLLTGLILRADGPGVTSRVRIASDGSNSGWEQTFFDAAVLAGMTRLPDETVDALATPDLDTPRTAGQDRAKKVSAPPPRRTVEYHIIQEESEQGGRSRKVKKQVVIEPPTKP